MFEEKVAIITGGGQGIGETYARRFAAAGASVVIAELNEEAGQRVGPHRQVLTKILRVRQKASEVPHDLRRDRRGYRDRSSRRGL